MTSPESPSTHPVRRPRLTFVSSAPSEGCASAAPVRTRRRTEASRWAEKTSPRNAFATEKAGRPSVRTNQSQLVDPAPCRGASVDAEMSYPLTRGVTRGRMRARSSRLNSDSVSWPESAAVAFVCWDASRTEVAHSAFERLFSSRRARLSPPRISPKATLDTESMCVSSSAYADAERGVWLRSAISPKAWPALRTARRRRSEPLVSRSSTLPWTMMKKWSPRSPSSKTYSPAATRTDSEMRRISPRSAASSPWKRATSRSLAPISFLDSVSGAPPSSSAGLCGSSMYGGSPAPARIGGRCREGVGSAGARLS